MIVISTGGSLLMGALMLLFYSLGHGVLVMVAGTSVGWVNGISSSERFRLSGDLIRNVFGLLLFVLSLYLFYSAFA
ncbi:MAG: hypothetical protein MZV65_47090 [Chromatiales bacterium]|nr:hypothetical protein [Chromatiales bacterium]